MRRPRITTVAVAALLIGATTFVATAADRPRPATAAAAVDAYSWKNVRIDGGGFVPGLIFNRTEKNLIYARTIGCEAYGGENTAHLITRCQVRPHGGLLCRNPPLNYQRIFYGLNDPVLHLVR